MQPFFEKPLRAIIDRNVLLSDVCRGVVSFERDLRDAPDPQARIQCIERSAYNLRRPALDERWASATTIMEAKGSRRAQERPTLFHEPRQYLRRFQ
ncbi:MAG: hypothetical protein IPF64_16375 [Flavobacteriales bacterium]|nr:hypothetical protein [Flavobacteriales bacterium]